MAQQNNQYNSFTGNDIPYQDDQGNWSGGYTGNGGAIVQPQQQSSQIQPSQTEDHSTGSAWDKSNLSQLAQQQQAGKQQFRNNNTGAQATFDPASGMYIDTNGVQIRPDAVVSGQTGQSGQSGPLPPNPGSGNSADTSGLSGAGQMSSLIEQLMKRANGSLDINPNTDPIIRPQVDNYAAQQERERRNAINQQAEAGSPYSTGALQNEQTQLTERAGQNTANMQSQLMQNELASRRQEIQQALQESGSLLTGQQQLSLQRELGLLDAQLKQQQITSGNDQFTARLGLDASNQNNYWDSIRSGLL